MGADHVKQYEAYFRELVEKEVSKTLGDEEGELVLALGHLWKSLSEEERKEVGVFTDALVVEFPASLHLYSARRALALRRYRELHETWDRGREGDTTNRQFDRIVELKRAFSAVVKTMSASDREDVGAELDRIYGKNTKKLRDGWLGRSSS